MADPAGSSLLNIRDTFSRSTFSGSTFRGEDTVNKREFVEQSKKFVETQQKDQQSLSTIQQQINNLQTQINTLSAGLVQVRSLIEKDTVSEQTLLRKEQEEERKYAQRKIRTGNENQLEQKIASALTAPVQQAAAKVENIFSRIGQALQTLFLGWLTVQGVKALKAYADKDYDALIDIKNNVIKNVGLGIAAIASIKIGLGLVTKAITGVVAKIGSIIANIIKAPFKVVGAAATGLASMLGGGKKPPASGPGAAPPAAAPPKKPNIAQRAAGAAKGALKNLGGPFIQGTIGTGIDIAMGEEPGRAVTGAAGGVTAGAVGAKVGSILGPVGALVGGIGGYALGSGFGKEQYNKFMGKPQPTAVTPTAAKPTAAKPQSPAIPTSTSNSSKNKPTAETSSTTNQKENLPPPMLQNMDEAEKVTPKLSPQTSNDKGENVTPQTSMMPVSSDLSLNINADKSQKENDYWKSEAEYWDTISKGLEAGSSYEELGLNQQEIDYLEGKTDTPPFLANEKMVAIEGKTTELTGEMMETKPITPPSIPPLQEPAPNVTIAAAPQQQQQKTAIPSSTGTDVPFIPSANPDNFYVMYSKLNYNVVM
jgi:hypothetical protein